MSVKNSFSKNVMVLLSGTLLAQLIPILVIPLLTRLYDPLSFGAYAIYLAIVLIASIVATGRYEQAILLVADDQDAIHLTRLSILLTICTSTILLAVILFLLRSSWLHSIELDWWYLVLAPFAVLITGVHESLNYWCNRKQKYRLLASNRVCRNSVISGGQVALFLLPGGLMLGDIIGRVVALVGLYRNSVKELRGPVDLSRMKALAYRYRRFPIFDASALLANISSFQVQNLLVPTLFGAAVAGNYFLVLRALQYPISIVSAGITDVYKQKLSMIDVSDEHKSESLAAYYLKMFAFLIIIGSLPFYILWQYAEYLFALAFGDQWVNAGQYASLLAPMFFIRFVASPLNYFLYLREKQLQNMLLQFLLMGIAIVAVTQSNTMIEAVSRIAWLFSGVYIFYLAYSSFLAGVWSRNARNSNTIK